MSVYLAWPLKIKPEFEVPEAHVTLVYLGKTATANNAQIRGLIGSQFIELRLPALEWRPRIFSSKDAPQVFVMELTGLDFRLWRLRKNLEIYNGSEHKMWVPHITFERDVWARIVTNKLKIEDVVESAGPLGLFVGGSPVETYSSGEAVG